MPPFAFWCQCCQLSSILGLSEDIVKSGFDHSIVRLPILSSPIYLFTNNFSVFFFLDKELEKVLDIEVTSDTKQRIFCFSFSNHLTMKLRAGKVFSRVCLSIQGWGSPPCRPPSLAPPLGTPLVCNSIHGGVLCMMSLSVWLAGVSLSKGSMSRGGSLSEGSLCHGDTPRAVKNVRPPSYCQYWNAFLLTKLFAHYVLSAL